MIPKKQIGELIIASYAFLLSGLTIISGKYMKYDEELVKEILRTWI
jgi:hypothetical protein